MTFLAILNLAFAALNGWAALWPDNGLAAINLLAGGLNIFVAALVMHDSLRDWVAGAHS